ncbi:ABC transporter ATP-binding protein [Eubacterium oxidoreducens]|uniref:ABC-2 type transport system ATP-binding protein n=1 Tax=Eubacterium oxidoreducens TaxID=1732 RepID=A0A1G6AG08_EUBOX|nr:ABC transporter ATP-binding protein [Eubacterium oxidoreducens]SDB07314.1 ABC-2 type transport system ATP-binding protein [Eubacterium oxidoreducens]
MIEINHLVKKYGDHTAVDDLTMKIEPGRIYGFLGPNGAGKSTTMNILTGYLGATSGEVKVNGFDILKQPEQAKASVGYLPEIPPLYGEMTVEEFLKFVAELKKIEKEKRQGMVEEVMERIGLDDMRNRLIRNLSKGYKQRVGLAQAIIGYPEIIILDEPTVGLDPQQIIEIRNLIRELGKEHTVILSSHILTEVKEVCDYIFIISNGRLVANDDKETLLSQMDGEQHVHMFVEASEEEVKKTLAQVDQIDEVKVLEKEGGCEVVVVMSAKIDLRRDLFFAFSDNQLPILEMYVQKKSLEEVFLELTGEQSTNEMDFPTVSSLDDSAKTQGDNKEQEVPAMTVTKVLEQEQQEGDEQ